MAPIVSVRDLTKTYASGFQALKSVSLDIEQGELLALLGPNGAGKTTLISVICGLVSPTAGSVTVGGHDIGRGYREARSMIGLVPQELALEPFETVINALRYSRGLNGMAPDDDYLDGVLKQLSLFDKRDGPIIALSGGMKRRVLIAKALAHGPKVLFLDEPSAGVDVALRKDMWEVVRDLQKAGTTIILTTHYIEEAEEMADRIAVIDKGQIQLVEEKAHLMKRLGRKEIVIELTAPLTALPEALAHHALELGEGGDTLVYTYDTQGERTGITRLLNDVQQAGLVLCDVQTRQSSLEDIFVDLVKEAAA